MLRLSLVTILTELAKKTEEFEGWQKFLIQTLSGRRITSLQKRKQKKQLQHQQTNVELLASPSRDETNLLSLENDTHAPLA
jgi:hypothetical protein